MPIKSSTIWNATPSSRPNRSIIATVSSSAPAHRAPKAHAQPINAAVFPLAIPSQYSIVGTGSGAVRQSSCCARHSSITVDSRRRKADPATASGSWAASTCAANACRPSPSRIASDTPHTAQTVGRFRRVASQSITSSWIRVKLWISSTAAAALAAALGSPPHAVQLQTVSAGRTSFPAPPPLPGPPVASDQPK